MLWSFGVNAAVKLEETRFVPLCRVGHNLGEQVKQPFVLFWAINAGYRGLRYFSAPEESSG